MPEPVSTTLGICWLGYTLAQGYARGGSAVSPEAQSVQRHAIAMMESVERSRALFGEKAVALSLLRKLAIECGRENWDGNDANAVDSLAVAMAEDFIRALPESVPLPDFAPEPDGAISLDWSESRSRIFSLSIGNSFRLPYAWLDGADKGHGVARFDGVAVPKKILEGIAAILPYEPAKLRAA